MSAKGPSRAGTAAGKEAQVKAAHAAWPGEAQDPETQDPLKMQVGLKLGDWLKVCRSKWVPSFSMVR